MATEPAGSSLATLKALSETCHALRNMAQPILYHYPDVKTYTPFFKTVMARPDLAASVRVLARMYESEHIRFKRQPPQHSKEDIPFLIQLGQQFELHQRDDDADADLDSDAEDDDQFKRCFAWLGCGADWDDVGYTKGMAKVAYHKFLIALHLCILPQLQFLALDIDDGRSYIRHEPLQSGRLLFRQPYLPAAAAAHPDHFLHVDTVILRNAYDYRQDSLGLESVSFLLAALPNVRRVFFANLLGEKRQGQLDASSSSAPAELSWPALPRLEAIYFDSCLRPHDVPPLAAIRNMLERCPRLRKLVYRHKLPDQDQPTLPFAPARLLDAILPTKWTLAHLELSCHTAKIPSVPRETLLDPRLKELTMLTTLLLDEELFCQHWLDDLCLDSCLVNILPDNISHLTVRLHCKCKTIPDILRLGHEVAAGSYPQLSRVHVHVLRDMRTAGNERKCNMNRDPDDLLRGIPHEKWEQTPQSLTDTIQPALQEAFASTSVAVEIQYMSYEMVSKQSRPWY